MKRLLICLGLLLGLAACETVKGAGMDIQNAGRAITGASASAQRSM